MHEAHPHGANVEEYCHRLRAEYRKLRRQELGFELSRESDPEKQDALLDKLNALQAGPRVRVVEIDGEPWFVGKDIAAALGYKDTVNALKTRVDQEDKKGGCQITTPSGEQDMTIINESGVYSLIFSSKLESAQKFKRWVVAEVLPSIRKTGGYLSPELIEKLNALAGAVKSIADRVTALEDAADLFGPAPALPASPPSSTMRSRGTTLRTTSTTTWPPKTGDGKLQKTPSACIRLTGAFDVQAERRLTT